ncbi:MAG TPA: phospholipase D-like domain-containing protein [Saprospiraceae bacterium]|nr:phospholipase D-like domain-containing protein [Saprospiraceae bacterium]
MKKNPPAEDFTTVNKVKLVRAGREFFDTLLQLIRDAKDSIHVQMYIYDDDETGRSVAEALKEAANRKVSVYLLTDGYASSMSKEFTVELKAAGIHFRYFEPLMRSKHFYFGRRLHQKLVVVDAKFALVGGINISDRYNDMPEQSAWLDFALWVEGEIVKELCVLAWKTWNAFPRHMGITPCETKPIEFDIPEGERRQVRMRRNDWVRRKGQISASYLQMLNAAKSNVIILSGYFLPGRTIRRSLRKAVLRGIKIKIILAGQSDVMLAKRAERWYYDWLLRNGIELFEYQENILHGKLATADDQWMTIGSYNINDISAYASIELNLEVADPVFAKQTRLMLEKLMLNGCVPITPEKYTRSKNIFKQFINWLSYEVFRVLFFLFTFYFKQRS